eukprot:GFUD01094536.1.p1 GENE.GFUD01094536.1~~GFUD01094536.1.p1  ORF type:complete len:168 (-),score=11.70 GFUD01094536.1:136-603(-)
MKQYAAILVLAILVFGGQAQILGGCRNPTGNIGQLATCERVWWFGKWIPYPTVFDGQCVKDNIPNRVLDAGYVNLTGVNTPELCIAKCKVMPTKLPNTAPGYKLAGVEFGYQCFCGNAVTPLSLVSKTECDYPCPGNAREMCGGRNRMNVFATGK